MVNLRRQSHKRAVTAVTALAEQLLHPESGRPKTGELRSPGQPRAAVPTCSLMPKLFYRRNLPHLQRDYKPHFVTFCTYQRWTLPEPARDLAIECCLHDNEQKIRVHAVVVMPDHVHMIFTPLVNEQASEVYSLAEIMDAIKGASARKINRQLGHAGRVWQTESFDRVLRSSESLGRKDPVHPRQPGSQRAGFTVD